MDGKEELLQTLFEVAFVELSDGLDVLDVGLRLFQGLVYGLWVVETLGEGDNLRSDEDVASGDLFLQLDAVQRGATAQGHIGLSAGEYPSGKVYHHPAEGQPLAFVNGDGPCQADGVLDEYAQFLLLYLFLRFVISVADVAPLVLLHVVFTAVFGDDV